MDFVKYANVALSFVNSDTLYVPYVVGGVCFLIVFVFQAVGLFVIAGREGYKNRWMAFIPFFNTYYIGVCGQKNRTFKTVDTRIFSLIAAIVEALLVGCFIINSIAQFSLADFIIKDTVTTGYGFSYKINTISTEINSHPELFWAVWCFNYLDTYIINSLELAFLVMQVFTLSAFFQTFAARRYMLFTITSILFPVQGILIFILRNNSGMNYREFVRREQERQYRMYQQYRRQQSFDQNPYNQNPYSRNPYEGEYGDSNSNAENGNSQRKDTPEDPFSEFGNGNNGNDPFEN